MSPEENGKDTPQDPPKDNSEQETEPEATESQDDSPKEDAAKPEEEAGDAPLVKQEINVAPTRGKSRARGFVDFLILLVLAGLGGGEYVLYQKQKADREMTAMKLAGIEHKLEALSSRKPAAPAAPGVPPEIQSTLENLSAQVGELKGQVEAARSQAEETRSWAQGEMEKLQSAPPPAAPVEEEPVEEEPPAEESHAEEAEPEAHDADGETHPQEDFIAFVENMFRIVGNGIKDGVVFVWDSISDLAGGSDESS